uniref:GST C-terminal domain-containing protein n=1 Tax=Ditylenchus dipsaci TaxID=166011 RepID=A0A915D4W6_9BILA
MYDDFPVILTYNNFLIFSALAGQGDWEQAKVDEFADFHKDVMLLFCQFQVLCIYLPVDKKKSPETVSNALKAAEELFPFYERQLQAFDSGLLFPSITWADFFVADFFETFSRAFPVIWSGYPTLQQYHQKVHSLPQLVNYLKTRKSTPN